jgi:hypothetical protein
MKLRANAVIAMMAAGQLLTAGTRAADCGTVLKLRVLDGRPVTDCVFVDGHGPFRFLIDTGAQANQLDPKAAREAGIEPNFQSNMVSPAGVVTVSGATGLAVTLGEVKTGDQKFLFGGVEAIQRFAPEIQGVLGQQFLSHFDYLLDLDQKRLTFGKTDAGSVRIEFHMTHGLPAVPTSLGSLLLDSGAGQVVLFGVGAESRGQGVVTVSGNTMVGKFSGKPLAVGGRNVSYGEALTIPRKNEDVDAVGILPARLFKTVYVCNTEGYVVLN